MSVARYTVWDHTSGGYCDPHIAADCAKCRQQGDDGDWVRFDDAANLSRTDAETILHMADVCFGEGVGPDYADLINRIRAQYPDIAESYSHVYRDWHLHQNLDEAPARVITRVMDDGIKTKDGAA